jgi:hypothetical protein
MGLSDVLTNVLYLDPNDFRAFTAAIQARVEGWLQHLPSIPHVRDVASAVTAAVSPPLPPSELPARIPAAPPRDADDPLALLRVWAGNDLSGKERRVVELLCDGGGECPLPDMAADPAIQWDSPWVDNWNSTRKRLRPKLRKRGWALHRRDNRAKLTRLPADQERTN